jgi:hypothetical protein
VVHSGDMCAVENAGRNWENRVCRCRVGLHVSVLRVLSFFSCSALYELDCKVLP